MIRDILEGSLAVLLAFLAYSLLGWAAPALLPAVNVFSLAVACFGVLKGEIPGAILGTVGGLVQDSFSWGVFGVAGLSKTLLGFAAGYISRKINVAPFFRSFLFLAALMTVELVLWSSLQAFVFAEKIPLQKGLFFLQPFLTSFLASLLLYFERRYSRARS